MALNNFVKSIRNIMRNDAGINGDAQRIEQIAWMLFLKDMTRRKTIGSSMRTITFRSFLKSVVGATGLKTMAMAKR